MKENEKKSGEFETRRTSNSGGCQTLEVPLSRVEPFSPRLFRRDCSTRHTSVHSNVAGSFPSRVAIPQASPVKLFLHCHSLRPPHYRSLGCSSRNPILLLCPAVLCIFFFVFLFSTFLSTSLLQILIGNFRVAFNIAERD